MLIQHCDATLWWGHADVVFTHPYGPIPSCLHGKPTILNLCEGSEDRRWIAQEWVNAPLKRIGIWGRGHDNAVYVAHLPKRRVDIFDLIEEEIAPRRGWMPLELPLRLLRAFDDIIKPGMIVWDGFCGRGTIGKACREFGLDYIGLDIDNSRVKMAQDYLGC